MRKSSVRKPQIKEPEVTYATNLDLQRLELRLDEVIRRIDSSESSLNHRIESVDSNMNRRITDQRNEMRIYFTILCILVTLFRFLG